MKQKGEKLTVEQALDSLPTLALAIDLVGRVAPNVGRYLLRGLEGAENTRLAYSADLRSYEGYCTRHQLTPWPAGLEVLAGYVAHLADAGRKLATINRHLAAIEKNHQLLGLPSAITVPALDVLRRGVAREIGKKQKQAPAFSVPHLKRCIDGLDLTRPEGLRARALLLLGFAGAFRRSELVALNLEDLHLVHEAADEVLVITLPKSKTNQTGDTEQKAIFYANSPAYCPVRAYLAWLAVLGGRTEGPLFVSLLRGRPGEPGRPSGKRLADRRVNLLVKEHLGAKFSAHSLRVSFITTARLAGQSNEFIKNQTGQKTDAMISRYSRLSDIIKYNAGRALGL
jgi:site-specific recombinase XerD